MVVISKMIDLYHKYLRNKYPNNKCLNLPFTSLFRLYNKIEVYLDNNNHKKYLNNQDRYLVNNSNNNQEGYLVNNNNNLNNQVVYLVNNSNLSNQ